MVYVAYVQMAGCGHTVRKAQNNLGQQIPLKPNITLKAGLISVIEKVFQGLLQPNSEYPNIHI